MLRSEPLCVVGGRICGALAAPAHPPALVRRGWCSLWPLLLKSCPPHPRTEQQGNLQRLHSTCSFLYVDSLVDALCQCENFNQGSLT